MENQSAEEIWAKERRLVTLVYILYFIGFATGISAIAGLAIAHAKSGEVDELWQSHLDYQTRTFWYGIAMLITGTVLMFVLIGWLVIIWWFIWTAIRCVKGVMAANEDRVIDDPATWMW